MKDKIIKILEDNSKDMNHWYGHSPNIGVSEDDFEDIAEEIIKTLTENKLTGDPRYL